VIENKTQKFCSIPLLYFQRFNHGAALKIERKMSHLNIAFNRYASIGTVMHYTFVINKPELPVKIQHSRLRFIRTH